MKFIFVHFIFTKKPQRKWHDTQAFKMFFQSMRNAYRVMIPQMNTILMKSPVLSAVSSKAFHGLARNIVGHLPGISINVESKLLSPATPQLMPSCGFKVKGHVRRRCKDCYFVMRQGRLYNICHTHPRHKQMAMQKAPRNTWILTHATQSKVRPW